MTDEAVQTGTGDYLEELALAGWTFAAEAGTLRYSAPKSPAVAEQLKELARRKPEVLRLLAETPDRFAISTLSYGQRALWFLWKLAGQSSAYNQTLTVPMPTGETAEPWRVACESLLRRHAILRTTFHERAGEPVQRVHGHGELDWEVVDAVEWDADRVKAAMQASHDEPFDLERGPVVRFRWYGLAGRRAALKVTLHHIATDGWTMEIFRRELPYLRAGTELPKAPAYQEYVRWQREMLAGAEGVRLWSYWRGKLAEPLPRHALPSDRPRPALQTYAGAAVEFEVPQALTGALRGLAQDEGATMFVVLAAALYVLLWRWTGHREHLVGTPMAGRTKTEFTTAAGYFVDPVVLRAEVEERQTFRQLLGAVRTMVVEALDHQQMPFALLVERLRLARDPARSPLFDVTFNYHSRRGEAARVEEGLSALHQGGGKFDLTMAVVEREEGMAGALIWNTDLFERGTIERLTGAFTAILEGVVARPDEDLKAIALMPGRGLETVCRERLVGTGFGAGATVLDRFREMAALHSGRAAVRAEDGELTYFELDEKSDALALRLQGRGVARGSVVAVRTGRSRHFIVAMLAAFKCGAAYLPIDPGFPAELAEYMLQKAGAAAMVTERGLPAVGAACASILVDETVAGVGTVVRPGGDELAYVIYTSGSTGRPKGVAVRHGSLAAYTAAMCQELRIAPGDSFALVSTLAADVGHTAVFPALCSGACLHLLPERLAIDAAGFTEYLRVHRVDYLKAVPSQLAALLMDGPVLPRKALVLGGEGSALGWVRELQAAAPECAIYNSYGPTETTVAVLLYRFDPREDLGMLAVMPLRQAIAGAEIYVLDDALQPVPQGFAGELFVGGACLGEGYIHDEELTAERFLWLSDGAGKVRVYRTGDRARQLANGDLELLGRGDQQVNLHGYRVELAQVEAVLREYPAVRAGVVLLEEQARLCAYVEAAGVEKNDPGLAPRLREHLERRLPRYMVPGQLHLVDSMPVTVNGKIDVARLRGSAPAVTAAEERRVPPRSEVERKLAAMWRQLLGMPEVGVREDFFQLGGHSLLCVRLGAMIEREFGQKVSLGAFFLLRTIEGLADFLQGDPPTSVRKDLLTFREGGSGAPLICLPGAGGSVLYFEPVARLLTVDRPVLGLQGFGAGGELVETVPELARRSLEALRKELQPNQAVLLLGHSYGGLVAFEMARQLAARGETVAFLGVLDNPAPRLAPSARQQGWSRGQWQRHIGVRLQKLYGIDLELDNAGAMEGEWLAERMAAMQLFGSELGAEDFSRFVDGYVANAVAASRYTAPGELWPGKVTLFRAEEEDADLRQEEEREGDETLGWGGCAREVEVVRVGGTHITMLMEPFAKGLSDAVSLRIHALG